MVVDLAEWLGNKQEKMKCVLEKKKKYLNLQSLTECLKIITNDYCNCHG